MKSRQSCCFHAVTQITNWNMNELNLYFGVYIIVKLSWRWKMSHVCLCLRHRRYFLITSQYTHRNIHSSKTSKATMPCPRKLLAEKVLHVYYIQILQSKILSTLDRLGFALFIFSKFLSSRMYLWTSLGDFWQCPLINGDVFKTNKHTEFSG